MSPPIATILKGIPILDKSMLPKASPPAGSEVGTGGTAAKAVLGPGQFLGVGESQSCVGVVLTSGKAGEPTYAFYAELLKT
jgi:hypothetical protein